jgi:glycosyltransferase involved in cell wall biosynthesis
VSAWSPSWGRAPGGPAAGLDEAPAIGGVVEGLLAQPLLDAVVVVDNGSRDGTGRIARRAGARVVAEPRRGYGRACLSGVVAARGATVVVLLDGDAADDPRDLPRVAGPVLAGEADLVVGVRGRSGRERGAMTPQQVAGNRVAAALMAAVHGVRVTDLGPFRAIRRDRLLALGMTEMGYAWSVEMAVRAARAGLRYHEVPVAYRRRVGTSKVGGTLRGSVGAGAAIATAILRHSRARPETAP